LVVVFPTGITVRKSDGFAFDLELAPVIQNTRVTLILRYILASHGYWQRLLDRRTRGVRHRKGVVGFTPLFNKGLLGIAGETTVFGEIDLPIRFKGDARGDGFTSVGLAIVFGLGF
jgi:hypothetical protein